MSEPILSYELKNLLTKIKTEIVTEFPIRIITPNYLILAILEEPNCDGFSIFSKLMMDAEISIFKDFVIEQIMDDVKNSIPDTEAPQFSQEYDNLAEDISNSFGKTVNSSLMMSSIIITHDVLRNKLNSLGVTTEQLNDMVIAVTNNNINEIKPARKVKKKLSRTKDNDVQVESLNVRIIPEENNVVEANCVNMVREASTGKYNNIIGCDEVIDRIFDVLGKYGRNTVAIVGPNGVGKTSVVERMAKKLYDFDCPKLFRDKYIMKFGDTIDQGIIMEMNNKGKYIAFIDDLDRLFVNKDAEMNNAFVLGELFKQPNICTIVCMNDTLYSKNVESKQQLVRHIHKIVIEEPSGDTLTDIIKCGLSSFSDYHQVNYTDQAIKDSIRLAKRFITTEKCPKAAINILDGAGAHARLHTQESDELIVLRDRLNDIISQKNAITSSASAEEFDLKDQLIREEISLTNEINRLEEMSDNDIIDVNGDAVKFVVSSMTGVPVSEMDEDERARLKTLNSNLSACVIGQDDAVGDVCRAVKRQRVGLGNSNKPCVMLFVGTTGTGKSYLAKRLAYEIYGDENNMVRLDMSEYSEKTAVTKLYGASAGYIGYEEGGVLTEAIKKKPRCVLLLDEIEKAHSDVYNVFLQIFDEGRLSDNKGTLVDFKNTIIIMTSNVGAVAVTEKTAKIGFGNRDDDDADTKEIILKSIKKAFKPEFINRIDNICYFNKLTDDNLKHIIKNEVKKVKVRLQDLGYDLDESITDGQLIENIFDKVKEDAEYGARPIIREIQKQLEDKLTDYIIDNSVDTGFVFKYSDIY